MSWHMLGDGRPSNTFQRIRHPARIILSRTSQWPSSLRALPWLPPKSLQLSQGESPPDHPACVGTKDAQVQRVDRVLHDSRADALQVSEPKASGRQ
eukprot:2983479-Heterocapsa_arctica.AAC.1